MLFKALAVAAAIGGAVAQRPANESICDYYTTLLLKNNTAANQKTLLTLVVNTVVIGNYTQPNVGIVVPGILAAGEYNGTAVNLLPYFNGGFASSNRGSPMSVNFLDDGGAAPLKDNKPANGTSSNQYLLLTHLYEYFGALLGCSKQGMPDYPAYEGEPSQYQVHKFMDLSYAEVSYFITQVALSAASFGVAKEDIEVVGKALGGIFNVKCGPLTPVIPTQGPQLQSICTGADCPLAVNASCASYANVTRPSVAVSSLVPSVTASASGVATPAGGASSAAGSASGTATGSSASATASKAAAAHVVFPAGLAAFGAMIAYLL